MFLELYDIAGKVSVTDNKKWSQFAESGADITNEVAKGFAVLLQISKSNIFPFL